MPVFVAQQMYVFLATLYGGIVIGFIYDLYRIFRCVFKPKPIATIIEDLIFWMVISIIATIVLLFSNDGELRFYNFLGFVLGAVLYNIVLSKFIIKNMVILFRLFKKILSKIWYIVLFPLKLVYNMFKGPLYWIKKKLSLIYYKLNRLRQFSSRWYQEIKKYVKLILKKK